MKMSLFAFALAGAIGLAASVPAPARQTEKQRDPEALPPAPKADPKSVHIKAPNLDNVIIEVMPDKSRRLLLATEVCLREGALEVFLCKKGTKEHEAILRVDIDAQKLHELLLLSGAESGKPTQFVDPKTEQPKYKPATGSKIDVSVHYTKDGKTYTHPAQDWIWDSKRKAPIAHGWVFAGSMIITDPCNGKKFYAANSGDIISISNFPYSMLEIPSEISKDDAQLTFEAKTDRIPPLMSKVWLILEKK
ncbi:MAG: YdjY domain-containing protein [Planctomycetes bacterium]|nr:YdjY domain-containing protein [Planctomycetota bacterium]